MSDDPHCYQLLGPCVKGAGGRWTGQWKCWQYRSDNIHHVEVRRADYHPFKARP